MTSIKTLYPSSGLLLISCKIQQFVNETHIYEEVIGGCTETRKNCGQSPEGVREGIHGEIMSQRLKVAPEVFDKFHYVIE